LTEAGDEKIPDPIIKPTTSDRPFMNVKLLFFSRLCCPASTFGAEGVPSAEYPAPEDVRGNIAPAKSKADETE
jgi:hypothetical protein